jgi:hypothetical protein
MAGIESFQFLYKQKYGDIPGKGSVAVNTGYGKCVFDGNLLTCYKKSGEIFYATDFYSLAGAEAAEQIKVNDEKDISLNVQNSEIFADNSNATITGSGISLNAQNNTKANMYVSELNRVFADGENTQVVMKDHNPITPDKNYQSILLAMASNKASVITAGFNPNTENYGISLLGGTINQQGARNYGVASGQSDDSIVSFLGQQGSKFVDNEISQGFAYNGALIKQIGESENSNLFAFTDNSQAFQDSPLGKRKINSAGGKSNLSYLGNDPENYQFGDRTNSNREIQIFNLLNPIN